MAGICSRHRDYDANCKLCNTLPQNILPDYNKKVAEAEAAGTHSCAKCGYLYYLTVDSCPNCGTKKCDSN